MGSVAAGREDTVDTPSELGVLSGPYSSLGVGFSILVLLRTILVETPVEDFMGSAV